MKKLILSMSLLLTAGYMFAQTYSAPDVESYKKKIEKSDLTIQDAKKNTKTKTWISRGDLFFEIGSAYTKYVRSGMSKGECNLLMGKPLSVTTETISEKEYEVQNFDGVKLYFEGDVVVFWQMLTIVKEDSYFVALDSYKKVIELDPEKKTYKELTDKLTLLHNGFVQEGSNYYSLENYAEAAKNFEAAYNTYKLEPIAKEDTIFAYYAAVSYQTAKINEKAIELFKKSLELGYAQDGNTYLYLNACLQEIGDTISGISYLKEAIIVHPDNNNIINTLVIYYTSKGRNVNELLEYIKQAQEKSPSNSNLFFAEGLLHDKMKNIEGAKKSFLKTIELDSNNFGAYFNIGMMYINETSTLVDQANAVPLSESKKYDELTKKIEQKYMDALPYFENCYKVNPDYTDALITIKEITFQLRNKDPKFKQRNEEVKALLENR